MDRPRLVIDTNVWVSLVVWPSPLLASVLELALAGKARAVITGDADLLSLHPWRGVSILTPRQFVQTFADE